MSELSKWQLVSFISRGIAMVLGIIQGFIIVRILTIGEYGVVQLAVSIGAAFGIYQHLGLASGSTREISAAKDDTEIFKIFITAGVIRYLITFPLAIGMFALADHLAITTYKDPTLITPIKIYALILIIQGVQSIFNSVISGTKRFRNLFIYQAAISIVSVILFIPLVHVYRINGYFYAMAIFNLVSSITLGYIAFRPLKGKLVMPSGSDFKRLFKELLSISLAIYIVKIIYTFWEKTGPLVLGMEVSKEMVGVFAFGMMYAKKLLAISDAVTDVSLPVFSEKYVNNMAEFKQSFLENFNKIYVMILAVGIVATYWSKELIDILVGGHKYDASLPLILPLMGAFILYSNINIIKSSVIIPAKMVLVMILSFGALLGGTGLFYFVTVSRLGELTAMALGMLFGALAGNVVLSVGSKLKLNFKIFTHDHVLLFVQAAIFAYNGTLENIFVKVGVFILFTVLFVWGVSVTKFIERRDIEFAFVRVTKMRRTLFKVMGITRI